MSNALKIILVLVALYGGMRLVGLDPFGVDDPSIEELQAKAKELGREKVVVLLTGKDWCPPCIKLERNVIEAEEWKEFTDSEIIFHAYEYEAASRPASGVRGEALKRYQIEGFPTMVVLDASGKVLGEEVGYNDESASYFKEWIRSL